VKITKNNNIDNQFQEVLNQINEAKHNSYKAINKTLIELYSNIGEYISDKINNNLWGKSIVEELANYIKKEAPDAKGYGERNLWRMKQFYEIYRNNEKLSPLVTELSWTNNLIIISGTKTESERAFYINLAIKERLSKRELERQLSTGVYERTILANQSLSKTVKNLPQNTKNVFKDSYIVDFLDIPSKHSEKDLQKALVSSLKDFILEIGKDFAFLGQEYRLQVGDSDFYIDLLFYHRELQCLVAFELKIDKFKPAYLGQLEFYLEALDKDIRKDYENPSIGILLCHKKDDKVVEYALNRSISPTVIAEYETKLIPKEILKKKVNELFEMYESTK